jgi:hypothetical protein
MLPAVVFDRQHGQVGVRRQQRVDRVPERAEAGQLALQPAARQVLLGGGVAVGVRRALERDPGPPAAVSVQVPRLLGHRVADQLAEDRAHQAGGDPEVGGHRHDAVQHLPFPVGVLDRGRSLLLDLGDGRDQLAPLRDQADDPRVHLIEALPQVGDVWLLLGHCFPLTSQR